MRIGRNQDADSCRNYAGHNSDWTEAHGRIGRWNEISCSALRAVRRAQDDADAVSRVGIHWATEQCRDLLDHGVRGIHFYTLNRSDATRKIYENLGVSSTDALRQ